MNMKTISFLYFDNGLKKPKYSKDKANINES